MVLHEFPNLAWLKNQAESSFSNKRDASGRQLPNAGWPNVILNATTGNTFRDNIRGPLSLFTNISGKSAVEAGSKRVVVNEGFFFVTNHDQYYTLQIDQVKTETFNIHFGEYFAEQVIDSLSHHAEKLIDDQFQAPLSHLELYNKLHQKDAVIDQLIRELHEAGSDKLKEEEKLYQLMGALLRKNNIIKQSEKEIPVIKNSTREEIQKRMNTATDYIYSFYDKDISLDELAQAACLSKFHFLRLFKIAYGATPHQFITSVKIERAKALLKNQQDDVNVIAKNLGFDSASSFSRSFFNQVKMYPSQFRASFAG